MSDHERPLTAVGCNIFAGGFTLGVEKSFRVKAHLEHDDYGVKTFKLNRPHVPVFHGRSRWPLERFEGVDLLYANPPCAIVSVCGRSLREGAGAWRSDPRTQRVRDITELALAIRPRVLAMESVVQMYTRARELVNDQAARLLEAGYGVTHLMVNTGWHGTPQTRKRYFLMAHREPLSFERLNYAPPDTIGEVLREVSNPGWIPRAYPDHARLAALAQPNHGIRAGWEREHPPETWERSVNGVVGRPRMLEYKLDPSRVMGVFYGDFFWHPTEPRRIGLNEAKALCGFPEDFQFHRPGPAYSEMARGVMPAMGAWLARQVAGSLGGRRDGRVVGGAGTVNVLDLRRAPT